MLLVIYYPQSLMMNQQTEFATLRRVELDKTTGRVYVIFEVIDEKYKDFAMRVAQRDDIELVFRGEKLDFIGEEE